MLRFIKKNVLSRKKKVISGTKLFKTQKIRNHVTQTLNTSPIIIPMEI